MLKLGQIVIHNQDGLVKIRGSYTRGNQYDCRDGVTLIAEAGIVYQYSECDSEGNLVTGNI